MGRLAYFEGPHMETKQSIPLEGPPLASLSHQVSNPLATIVLLTHLIKRQIKAGEVDLHALEDCALKIEQMAFRVSELVKATERP